jgi:hypothetical protein
VRVAVVVVVVVVVEKELPAGVAVVMMRWV